MGQQLNAVESIHLHHDEGVGALKGSLMVRVTEVVAETIGITDEENSWMSDQCCTRFTTVRYLGFATLEPLSPWRASAVEWRGRLFLEIRDRNLTQSEGSCTCPCFS